MLQALLASAGLTTDDVDVVTYPDFGQGVAVAEGQVDAAVGFANNEPVQLEVAGIPVVLLRIDEVAPLPGPGLTVGRETLLAKGDAVRAFRDATLRAMADIIADPEVGLDAAFAWLPELGDDEATLATQRAVLEATVESWSSDLTDAHGLGSVDPATWESAIAIMSELPDSVVADGLTVDQLVAPDFAPSIRTGVELIPGGCGSSAMTDTWRHDRPRYPHPSPLRGCRRARRRLRARP